MTKFIVYTLIGLAITGFIGYKASWHIKHETKCVEFVEDLTPYYERHGTVMRKVGYITERECIKYETVKR